MASTRADRLVPAGLILLSAVPALAAALRLADLSGVADVTTDDARFAAAPVPIVVHVIAAGLFTVVGALQFAPTLRRRHWHRRAGRVLVPLGLAAALSGLWMTAFFPHPAHDGVLLGVFRAVFGSAMVVALVLGANALRRRDFARHGAWLTRAYAIGLGAGTQAVFLGFWAAVAGEPAVLARALLHAAAWTLNLAVAEWVISRRSRPDHSSPIEEEPRDHIDRDDASHRPARLRPTGAGARTGRDRPARTR
ncbi:DUF2306 domain-containing protein [Nocardia sp. NPDC005366]|uniref:DUF2306 domain-containing protein n=1 Tax=Nocardia sp. NPDC005366 TaxID=3156878 RepID=UPI0033A36883